MSTHNTPPSAAAFARAAELRAAGHNWETVGEAVHRAARSVRRWPRKYPEQWLAALRAAELRIAAEAGGESLLVLRQLLRSKDDKMRWHAAKSLVHVHLEREKLDLKARAVARQSSPESKSEVQLLVALLEGNSDEHLAHIVAPELALPPATVPVDPAGPPHGP